MSAARMSVFISVLMLAACAHAQADAGGATVERGGELPDFQGVSVGYGIRAEVKVGPKSVRLEGPEELVARVRLEVKDGTLVTRVEKKGFFDSFRGGKVLLYVSTPTLTSASASGGARVDAEATATQQFTSEASGGASLTVRNVDAAKVVAESSGGARVTLEGRAQELSADASGGAVVDATALKGVQSLAADASGGARVEADAPRKVTGEASGGGVIRLSARPESKDVETSGGGKLSY